MLCWSNIKKLLYSSQIINFPLEIVIGMMQIYNHMKLHTIIYHLQLLDFGNHLRKNQTDI